MPSVGFFGSALSGLGGSAIGSAVVTLYLADRTYDAQLRQAQAKTEAATATMGQKIKAIGPAAAVAGAAIAIGIGVQAVKAFEESEAAIAQTNAVLKSTKGIAGVTAQQVGDLATEMQNLTTFSDEEVRSAENLLLTFTKIGADIFPQTTKAVLDMSQALGQDLKSSSIQLGKALNDPLVGLTALRRVGVAFSEQQVQQIELLVEHNDLLGAQRKILAEVSKEFGGSAQAAAKTFSGQIRQLSNQFGEVLEVLGELIVSLGKVFLPLLRYSIQQLKFFIDLISDAVHGIADIIPTAEKNAEAMKKVGQAFRDGAISAAVAEEAVRRFAEVQGFSKARTTAAVAALHGYDVNTKQITTDVESFLPILRGEADRLGGVGDAARGAARGVHRFANLSADDLKSFRQDARTNLNFVAAKFEDLAGAAHQSAQHILRELRKSLRDQRQFAENAVGFLDTVRENFGPRLQTAAEEMVRILQAQGRDGAATLAALAGASDRQIGAILRTFSKGNTGIDKTVDHITGVGRALDQLPSKKVIEVELKFAATGVGSFPETSKAIIDKALADGLIRGQTS